MAENSKLAKLPKWLLEEERLMFEQFESPTEADLAASGIKSQNDLTFSIKPSALRVKRVE